MSPAGKIVNNETHHSSEKNRREVANLRREVQELMLKDDSSDSLVMDEDDY